MMHCKKALWRILKTVRLQLLQTMLKQSCFRNKFRTVPLWFEYSAGALQIVHVTKRLTGITIHETPTSVSMIIGGGMAMHILQQLFQVKIYVVANSDTYPRAVTPVVDHSLDHCAL